MLRGPVSRSRTSHFEVGKLWLNHIFCFSMIAWPYFEFMWLVWCCDIWGHMNELVWFGVGDCCRKTVARPANLAQASQSRLGEINRDSPKPFYARGRPGDPLNFFLASEHLAQARGVSPKRDPALVPGSSFEPSPMQRGLAWARPFSLSEGLSGTVLCLVAWLFLDAWKLFGLHGNCITR